MISLNEVRGRLKEEFLERLGRQFDVLTIDQILRGFSEERMPVLRVNTLKTTTQEMMRYFREQNIRFERVLFLNDALVILNRTEKDFENLDIYKEGKMYFQGISSQLPAMILGVKPGEKVLDLAAAPGGKTAQMACLMQNQGEIVANEIDQVRMEKMKYNLLKQGVAIAETRLSNGVFVGKEMPEFFDKVLLDAPCSAEGRIEIKNPRSYGFWSEKNIRNNAKLQKALFASAFMALRRGGTMVYSTCTLAPEENEMIVDRALREFRGQIRTEKIVLDFKYKLPVLRNFGGVAFDQGVQNCIKASPGKVTEGFFVAKFVKK